MIASTFPALEGARARGDKLADGLVDSLFRLGGPKAVDMLLRHLVSHDEFPTEFPEAVRDMVVEFGGDTATLHSLDDEIRHYLLESARPPKGFALDEEKVKRGEDLFMEAGVLSLLALLHASLPTCYLMENGVEVLGATQQLEKHTFRRLLETAQMLVGVMSPGGIRVDPKSDPSDPNGALLVGAGVTAAQKVRLLHASVRHLLMRRLLMSPGPDEAGGYVSVEDLSEALTQIDWNSKELGRPINQEDMAYTLLTFGLTIPTSLVKLGVPLTRETQESLLHTWNVVGTIMGVEEELIAHTLEDATDLLHTIQASQAGESEDGKKLTAALITCVESVIPFSWLRWVPPVLVWHLVDPKWAHCLGVPRPSFSENLRYSLIHILFSGLARLEIGLTGRSFFAKRLFLWIGQHIVAGLASLPRDDGVAMQRPILQLTDDHRKAWGLPKGSAS